MPWRKLIQFIFKQYIDGMNSAEELKEDFFRTLITFLLSLELS
jgi:hypothetical protein